MNYFLVYFYVIIYNYLGEPTPYNNDSWPSHSSVFGIIDLANLPKDRYYLYRSVWNKDGDTLHVLPHWTWPGRAGQVTPVMVYTDYPEAELFINGKSQGRQRKWTVQEVASSADSLAVLRRYRLLWEQVIYEPGEIMVVAYDDAGKEAGQKTVRTAGKPRKILLEHEPLQSSQLQMLTLTIVDAKDIPCPDADNEVSVTVTGGAQFVAMANGDPTCLTSFSSSKMKAFHGQLTFYLRRLSPKPILIKVKSSGLQPVVMHLP